MKKRFSEDDLPFLFGGTTEGDTFTDRRQETARLAANFRHHINTVLVSPRRIGKTSLVKKVAEEVSSPQLKVVFLDIFSCRSEQEFYDLFTTAILRQTSSKFEEIMETAKNFLSRITPRFSIGPDPMSDFSIALELSSKSEAINDILQLPQKIAEKKGVRIVICIDEFQQIADFKDSKTFQKRLRTVWQHQTSVSYCLFGSKKHLMNELFERRNLPFYKFGDAMYLEKIPTQEWVEYICRRFKKTGKSISEALAERICTTVENHSSYVQQLAWLVWVQTDKRAGEREFAIAYQDLIAQNSPLFEQQTENLSAHQMRFLHALTDGVTSEFSSAEVLQKYRLGSSAGVTIVKRALIKKELIDTANRKIVLTDPVLRLWLRERIWPRG